MAQFFRGQGSIIDVPLLQRFVTDHDTALEQQFLHIPLTQGEAVVEPQGRDNHAQR